MSKNTGKWLLTLSTGTVLLAGGIWLGVSQLNDGNGDASGEDMVIDEGNVTEAPEDPEQQETPRPVPTPADLTIDEVPAQASVSEAAQSLVEQVIAVPPQDGTVGDSLSLVVADSLASQLNSLALEYLDHGWVATGSPVVSDVQTEEQEDGTITVIACIDSRGVEVKDAGGNIVSAEHPPTKNLFTMEKQDGRWVLIDQTFPQDPDC